MLAGLPPELRTSAAHVFVDDLDAPVLDHADGHHLSRVLRLKKGASVTIADGMGAWRLGTWTEQGVEPNSSTFELPPPTPLFRVGFAPTKGDRPEWTVQKLTELGVDVITPLQCDRSVVRWDRDRAARQRERWQRIARESSMQSRRVRIPIVEEPMALAHADLDGLVLRADPDGPSPISVLLGERRQKVTVLVGPEGGFSPAEIHAWPHTVTLGSQILRSETACLAAAIVVGGHLRGLFGPSGS